MAQIFHDAAVDHEARGDLAGAALRWAKVVELQPDWVEGWCRYGDVLAGLTRMDEAHRAWRQGAFHPGCAESQGLAYLDEHPSWALQRFQTLARLTAEDPRTDLLIARAQARLAPDKALQAMQHHLERVREDERSDALLRTTTAELVDALPPAEALDLLDRVTTRFPDLAGRFSETQLELEVEVRTRELMGAAPTSLTPEQRSDVERARDAAEEGDLPEARRILESLADQVSRSPVVWAALADVREGQGDIAGAEAAIQLARQLDPLNGALHARASDILATHYAMRFDDEALAALDRALDVAEDPALLERHARLALRAGRPAAARRSLERLQALGGGAVADPLLADLDRVRPEPLQLPPVPPPVGVDADAWRWVHRARVFVERARSPEGTWDPELLSRAEQAVHEALEIMPEFALALQLRGRLYVIRGALDEAIIAYRRSLAAEPDQPDVLGSLAELLLRVGAPDAQEVLAEADEAGSAFAMVTRARQDVAARRYLAARARLHRYFRVTSQSPWHDEAVALRDRVERDLRGLVALGLLLGLGLLGVPLVWIWNRRRGTDLLGFVQAHPRSLPEVARLLSAIRHEVIKHNVSTLPALAERQQRGDSVPLAWVQARLAGPQGALDRFRTYVAELESLARRAGDPVNLRHRDPVFRDGIRAMEAIGAACDGLQPSSVPLLARQAEQIVGPFYDALGRLLDGVSVVRLDEPVFRTAWATVSAERPEAAQGMRFDVEGRTDICVRIPRADLGDIVVNLLRNALQASEEEGREHLAVRVGTDEDFVTGLLRVEIRVCDQVERRLTTAMIRGRYIDRGLGLAVDLTSRAGGSIHVESEPGWAKAVVVRLPMEERR